MSGLRKDNDGDLLATLTAFLIGQEWFVADEARGMLRKLGHDLSPQKVAGMLNHACLLDAAPLESKRESYWKDYRLTSFGRNWLAQRFAGLDLREVRAPQ
jgi:hypothetical protein